VGAEVCVSSTSGGGKRSLISTRNGRSQLQETIPETLSRSPPESAVAAPDAARNPSATTSTRHARPKSVSPFLQHPRRDVRLRGAQPVCRTAQDAEVSYKGEGFDTLVRDRRHRLLSQWHRARPQAGRCLCRQRKVYSRLTIQGAPMTLIGYARVSTEDQVTLPQTEELQVAGCAEIHEEQASGASRQRPVLARVMARIRAGDVLVVVRIDRLARSLSHLLEVIEALESKGAHFRSIRDPIDTTSPQGKFTLQVLGAAAELERALIRERTVAGLISARAQGRVGGNPGLKARDPAALRRVAQARDKGYFARINGSAEEWVPLVRRLRPDMPWEDVVRVINSQLPKGRPHWTVERLVRATRRYVQDGLLEPQLITRARRTEGDDRLLAIVAGIAGADPAITLQAIATRLEAMRERTPRGRSGWAASSVKMLLDRAKTRGLL